MNAEQRFWITRPDIPHYWEPYLNDAAQTRTRLLMAALQKWCDDLPDGTTCHELGACLGRNLNAIHEAFPGWALSGNDVNAHAMDKLREVYPDLPVVYAVQSSEEWLEAGRPYDVVVSMAHFIHIKDFDRFVWWLPSLVRRYLVLFESAGTLTDPDSENYKHWNRRKGSGIAPWFDRDYEAAFAGTALGLVSRTHAVDLGHGRRYDVFVFEKRGAE
jgi:hypothetical protein